MAPSSKPIASFETCLDRLAQSGWSTAAPDFLRLWQNRPRDLKFGLMAGAGLVQIGREAEGAALLSHLADQGHIIRTAQYNNAIDPRLRDASELADKTIRRIFTQIQKNVIAHCTAAGRIRSALWPQTHDGPAPYPKSTHPPDRSRPRPYVFFAPDLPAVNVFESADWAKNLAKQTDEIREEFLALMSNDVKAGSPYVPAESPFGDDWADLKGQTSWKAVHLFKDHKKQAPASDCPLTCAALEALPVTRQNGIPIEAFFSVLAAGTTIPPHYGLANCRVTVHLPLIVPSPDAEICGIRVGERTLNWTAGQPLIFDDSFDHSAWNLSGQSRVVLIFEAWRPDMTEGEIAAVKASYEARESYHRQRSAIIKTLASESV